MRRTLTLHRETLAPLTSDELAGVAGMSLPTMRCSRIDCPTDWCPTLDYCRTLPIRDCLPPPE